MDANIYKSPFQFIGNSVSKFNMENNFLILDKNEDLKQKVDIEYDTDTEKVNEHWIGTVTLTIDAEVYKNPEEDEAKKAFNFLLEIDGAFAAPDTLSEEQFVQMLELNGCASVLSVARAFIISVSSQSLVEGQIVLPLLNVNSMHKARKKDKLKQKELESQHDKK